MEVVAGTEREHVVIDNNRGFRITEIPGQLILVTLDMTAGARGLTIARCKCGIVEKTPAGPDAVRLRVMQGYDLYLGITACVEYGNPVVLTRGHVESAI